MLSQALVDALALLERQSRLSEGREKRKQAEGEASCGRGGKGGERTPQQRPRKEEAAAKEACARKKKKKGREPEIIYREGLHTSEVDRRSYFLFLKSVLLLASGRGVSDE